MIRAVPEFPDYGVTKDGRVWSTDRIDKAGRRHAGRWLSPKKLNGGHLSVHLSRDGIKTEQLVHRLVLSTFVGPCPAGMEACHNNGNLADNRLENLRWDTRAENVKDAYRHGAKQPRNSHEEKNPNAKLTLSQVKEIRKLSLSRISAKSIADKFPVCLLQIYRIIGHKEW